MQGLIVCLVAVPAVVRDVTVEYRRKGEGPVDVKRFQLCIKTFEAQDEAALWRAGANRSIIIIIKFDGFDQIQNLTTQLFKFQEMFFD